MKKAVLVAVLVLAVTNMGTAAASPNVDDFEDGDVSEWTDLNGGGISIDTTNPYQGTYDGELTESDGTPSQAERSVSGRPVNLSIAMQSDGSGSVNDVRWRNSTDDIIGRVIDVNDASGSGSFSNSNIYITNSTYDTGVSSGTGYHMVNLTGIDYSTGTISKVYVDGSVVLTDIPLFSKMQSGDALDDVRLSFASYGNIDVVTIGESTLPNQPPVYNQVSTSPDPWKFLDTPDVTANVTDSDGNVSMVEATVLEDGVQINATNLTQNVTEPDLWSVDDLFTVDETDVYYNVTLTATDNDGDTSSTEIKQFINDTRVNISVGQPQNRTYFRYDPPYGVTVQSDGDDVPNETVTCELYQDGLLFRNESGTEGNFSLNGRLSSDFGQHTFTASCYNDTVTNISRVFNVSAIRVNSVTGESPVYETSTQSFETDLTIGSMVNNIDAQLEYNGSIVNSTTINGNGIFNQSTTLEESVPLIQTNTTDFNWKYVYDVNVTDINVSTTTVRNNESAQQSQTVEYAYFINNNVSIGEPYTENETYEHQVNVTKKVDAASISGTNTYNRTGNTVTSTINTSTTDWVTLVGSQNVGSVSSLNETFSTTSSSTFTFEGKSRTVSESDAFTVFQVRITDCSLDNDAEALTFNTFVEENQTVLKTDLQTSFEVFNGNGASRQYNFTSTAKTSHTFCVYPSDAQYTLTNTQQYGLTRVDDSNTTDAVDYTERIYYLLNQSVSSSSPATVPLFLLDKENAAQVIFEIRDENNEPYPNTFTRVDRYFPGDDVFRTVAMFRSSSEGEGKADLNTGSDVTYRFRTFDGAEFLQTFGPQQITDSPIVLQVGEVVEDGYFEILEDFKVTCSSNATRVSCDYTSSRDDLDYVKLDVSKDETIGSTQVCTRNASTASGTLICDGLNATENTYQYQFVAVLTNGQALTLVDESFGAVSDDAGETGLYLAFALIVGMAFAGLRSPDATILMTLLGVVGGHFMGVVPVSQAALTSVVLIGLYLVYKSG